MRVFFGDFDHAVTASGIAAAAAAAAAKARLLLLLMLSVIGEEAARHTHCSMVSTFTSIQGLRMGAGIRRRPCFG